MNRSATLLLNHQQITQRINRIAWQIFEDNSEEKEIFIIGIKNNGFVLAQRIQKAVQQICCKSRTHDAGTVKDDWKREHSGKSKKVTDSLDAALRLLRMPPAAKGIAREKTPGPRHACVALESAPSPTPA